MPPPMISVSTFSSRLEMTFSLSATLAPPRIAVKGRSGSLRVAEILDLLLHQVADSGILDIVGHTGGGAVSAVAGAEGVVNVSVGQAGQLLAESGLVLGLFLAETGVCSRTTSPLPWWQQHLGVLADDIVIVRKGNRLAQLLAQADSNGGQAELGLGAVLRLAQMAAQNDFSAVGNQLLDGRSAALMRLSLVITPSFIGTLKSQRTSTRLPA